MYKCRLDKKQKIQKRNDKVSSQKDTETVMVISLSENKKKILNRKLETE